MTTTAITGLGTKTRDLDDLPAHSSARSHRCWAPGPTRSRTPRATNSRAAPGSAQNFKVLYGDFNGDGVVSSADMTGIQTATVTGYNIFADLNGDGTVDINDVKIARSRIGTSV